MAKPNFQQFADLAAVDTTAALSVAHLEEAAVLIGGTFTATVSLEVSFDGGATWVPHPDATGLTAPKVVPLGMRAQQVRLNCTNYTSGTILGRLSGSDEDLRG